MMRLRCATCNVVAQVPKSATAFRCSNCQTLCTVPAGTKPTWADNMSAAGKTMDEVGKAIMGIGFALLVVGVILILAFCR